MWISRHNLVTVHISLLRSLREMWMTRLPIKRKMLKNFEDDCDEVWTYFNLWRTDWSTYHDVSWKHELGDGGCLHIGLGYWCDIHFMLQNMHILPFTPKEQTEVATMTGFSTISSINPSRCLEPYLLPPSSNCPTSASTSTSTLFHNAVSVRSASISSPPHTRRY